MKGTITVETREDKKWADGTPFLRIKSQKGAWFTVKEQALFHLCQPGKQLTIDYIDGQFKTITDIIDEDGTPHIGEPKPITPVPALDRIFTALVRMQEMMLENQAMLKTLIAKLPDQLSPDEKVVDDDGILLPL